MHLAPCKLSILRDLATPLLNLSLSVRNDTWLLWRKRPRRAFAEQRHGFPKIWHACLHVAAAFCAQLRYERRGYQWRGPQWRHLLASVLFALCARHRGFSSPKSSLATSKRNRGAKRNDSSAGKAMAMPKHRVVGTNVIAREKMKAARMAWRGVCC